jgi:hypothetical protein
MEIGTNAMTPLIPNHQQNKNTVLPIILSWHLICTKERCGEA